MDLIAMTYVTYVIYMTYMDLFLGILLMPLLGLAGAHGPCPAPCHCTLEIFNCSKTSGLPGFHQVPLPDPVTPPHPFMYLDFTGNVISSIGKEVWMAYPWTEHLVLKGNSLTKLQSTALEGLLSLTYLDLSCNKIEIIENNVFEPVPFLQIINLSGNNIQQVTSGTFRAWHGMQFLLKVDLSHNPLEVIQDSYFFHLPSLKFLNFGATDITPNILEGLLRTSLQLRTLVLPQKMSCCLCHMKEDIEVLSETIKLECGESCAPFATVCDKEEPLVKMQEEVMKIIEIRKINSSSLLHILPESALRKSHTPEHVEPKNDALALAESYSSLVANLNLLESVKRLLQAKADEPLDVNWADEGELKQLYLVVSLLQEALKERIVQLDMDSLVAPLHNGLSGQASKKPIEAFFRKKRHVRKVRRENWFGPNQRQEDEQGVAETTRQSSKEPRVSEWPSKVRNQREIAEGLNPRHDLPFVRSHQAALQSSWKRSISDSLIHAVKPTGSVTVNDDDNGRNHVSVLENGFGAHISAEEELLQQLLHRSSPPAEDAKSKISAINFRKKRHVRKVRRENWFGPNQRQEDEQGVAETTRQSAKEPRVSEWPSKARNQREIAEGLNPRHDLPFVRSHQAALQSSWKRSISDSLIHAVKSTDSVKVKDDDNGRNHVAVLENGFGEHILTEEELLQQLLHRSSPPAEDAKSKISAIDTEPSLNELSPDITLSQGTYWKHEKTSVSPSLDFLGLQDNYFPPRVFFETGLDRKLAFLIPNAPVRKLISHVIRILKMDCAAAPVQKACAKLISRTGLLMKLFSEREKDKETSSLWKSYFWPSKNVSNINTGRARNLEKPLAGQGEYGQRKKLVLAVSVTAILMIIILLICLNELCLQRCVGKDWTFLGRRKTPLADEELSKTDPASKDTNQTVYEIPKHTVDTLHYEDSSDSSEEIIKWGDEKPSERAVENIKSAPSTAPASPAEPDPSPSATSQKPGSKKGSDKTEGTPEASSKGASSAPTTEATAESPESGGGEDEDEDEEDEDE